MRRRLLGHRRGGGSASGFNFETVGTGDAFLIRRVSDNVEQSFTHEQIIDGTYATFISGTQGAILEWKSENGALSNFIPLSPLFLVENSGNPYVNDVTTAAGLILETPLNMESDWVISLIPKDELNNNNQRANLVVKQNSSNLFAMNIRGNGEISMMINREYNPAINAADFRFANNNLAYTLLTFERKSGVFKAYSNGVEQTLLTGGFSIRTLEAQDNYILLGRGLSDGKITKYRHVGVTTGAEATAINITDYNANLMTKYGI